mgnify:CR=1 FL=1
MSDEITLDKEVFKALAGETRVHVLKSLMERRKTQSELAKELKLAAPTIKDHLDILHKAGLVRELDDGHKWKYIELTVKGKSLLQPSDTRIMVLLGSSIVGIALSGYLAYTKFLNVAAENASAFSNETMMKSTIAQDAMIVSGEQAPAVSTEASLRTSEFAAQSFSFLPLAELSVLVLCLLVFGMAAGMWIKQTY